MLSLKKSFMFIAAIAFVAASVALASMASAQTMGEYGATVGNAAASAGAAPSMAPDLGNFKVSTQSGGSGPSQTILIRGDDSDEAAPRKTRSRPAKNTDRDDSADDWVQVK